MNRFTLGFVGTLASVWVSGQALATPTPPESSSKAVCLEERLAHHVHATLKVPAHALPGHRPAVQAYSTAPFTRHFVVSTRALFEPESSAFRAGYMRHLAPLTHHVLLQRRHHPLVTVRAYDNQRNLGEQRNLSQRQAEKVAAFFWMHGVPYDDLTFKGEGASHPVSSGHGITAANDNHRLEISLD